MKIIIYDFDGTLTPYPIPKLEILEKCGINKGLNNKDFLNKINNYFKNLGYNITNREFYITNKEFINSIENNDKILLLTDDEVVIGEVVSNGLATYEEVVINAKN